jgi:hypothetical protein
VAFTKVNNNLHKNNETCEASWDQLLKGALAQLADVRLRSIRQGIREGGVQGCSPFWQYQRVDAKKPSEVWSPGFRIRLFSLADEPRCYTGPKKVIWIKLSF